MNQAAILTSYSFPMFFLILLLAASAYALNSEMKPFATNLTSPIQRFSYLERGSGGPATSIQAQRFLLNDCLEAIAGPTGMAQPSQRRIPMLENCQSVAENAANSNPTFAFSWYVAAFASAELKQYDLFNFQLTAAQESAPNEQWLAQLRVNLAEDNLQYLSAEAGTGNNADLKLLVQSRVGVSSIASRYVTQRDFRERITLIVETMSDEEQRRFVNFVRAAARQAAPSAGFQ